MIKTIFLNLALLVLKIIYAFIKIFPTENKITFISRQSNKPSVDIKLLSEALKKSLPNYKIVVLSKKIDDGLINKICYCFHIIKQMYHIATSKIVILDSYCISISVLNHKKNLKVIQMWHAIGLLKKAGYSIVNKTEGRKQTLAKTLKMHNNYDYILVSSDNLRKPFQKVFNCSNSQLITLPLPRVDLLKNKKYHENNCIKIFEEYPIMKDKKNILYVPTFRKNEDCHQNKIYELISNVNFEEYNLIIKLHPLSKIKIENNNVINDNKFSSIEMISACDFVISDYSTIIYEAAIAKKPLFFYAFDKDNYKGNRGFFINYEKEMPGLISGDSKEIITAIENQNFNLRKVNQFLNKYVDMKFKSCTDEIVKFIRKNLK